MEAEKAAATEADVERKMEEVVEFQRAVHKHSDSWKRAHLTEGRTAISEMRIVESTELAKLANLIVAGAIQWLDMRLEFEP